jgi:hypothetical protein
VGFKPTSNIINLLIGSRGKKLSEKMKKKEKG